MLRTTLPLLPRTLPRAFPTRSPSTLRAISTSASVMAVGPNGTSNGVHTTADYGAQHTARGVNRLVHGVIVKGEGSYVTLDDGRRMLDFTTGIGVTGLGKLRSFHPSLVI